MIEFQYFKECPHYESTLQNLQALISENFISNSEVKVIEITNSKLAKEIHFQGSPTILYNGYDIYTERKPKGFSYSCRIYNINNVRTGILTKEYIKNQITKFRKNIIESK